MLLQFKEILQAISDIRKVSFVMKDGVVYKTPLVEGK